jgi:hypothetical protein
MRAAEVACGPLGWSPDAFWRATPAELGAALRGVTGGGGPDPVTGADLARLLETDDG